MKRIIFFIIINSLLITTITAQNDKKTLAVGIHINPNLLTKAPVRYIHEYDGSIYFDKKEGWIFGCGIGVNLTRYWNDKIGIETGIYFTQRGYYWKFTGVSQYDIIVDEITILSYCLDIPVSLRYRFFKSDKIDLHIIGGLIPYFVIKNKNTENCVIANGNITELWRLGTDDIRHVPTNINISALVGLGEEFSLTKNLNLQLEVLSNYNILRMSSGSTGRLLNFGIKSGIVYEF